MENQPLDIADRMHLSLMLDAANSGDLEAAERHGLRVLKSECKVFHHFGPRFVIREMHIPAGTFVIGHAHKQPLANMLVKGLIRVFSAGCWSTMEAPLFFVGSPGRKAAFALTDTIWQNILVTDERDPAKIEQIFVTHSDEWLAAQKHKGE